MNPNPFDKANPLHPNSRVNLRLKLSDTKPYKCKCGGNIFQTGMFFRTVSPLITGDKEERLTDIPAVFCISCKRPVTELLPDELQDELKTVDVPSIVVKDVVIDDKSILQ